MKILYKKKISNVILKNGSAYIFTQDAKELEKIRKEIKAVNAIGGKAEFKEKIEPNFENLQRSNRISRTSPV